MEGMPCAMDALARMLEPLDEFWSHWGFEPWAQGPFAGVARRQRFVKNGVLGPVAEYGAWDHITWASGSSSDRETLWRSLTSVPGVMTQRFVFLLDNPFPERRMRSFLLGFRGYAEFYAYRPAPDGGRGCAGAKDLTDLVDMGMRLGVTLP